MSTALRFEAEGDLEAAADAYVAIASSPSSNTDATLAAGRLLIELGRFEEALTVLDPVITGQPGTSVALAASYMAGRSLAAQDKQEQALPYFDAYIATGGPALPYAHLDRSYALLELGQGLEAVEAAELGLSLEMSPAMRLAFLLTAAQGYEKAAAYPEAIQYYNLVLAQGPFSFDAPLALARISALKKQIGDPTYTIERDRLLEDFPATAYALETLEQAEQVGETLDPTTYGLVLYRHNEYTLAEPYFREQIAAEPSAPRTAVAHYYLAAILESRLELDGALGNYAAVDLLDSTSFLADDALWWRARIHEQAGDTQLAGPLYSRIVRDYPTSLFADDAALRAGMLDYIDGAYAKAATAWETDIPFATTANQRQRLLLWQAKALQLAGQTTSAESVLTSLIAEAEDDYFGIRSRSLLEGSHAHSRASIEAATDLSPNWNWQAVEQWIADFTGLPATNRAWEADTRWLRAQELWRIGRQESGDLEVFDLMEGYTGDAAALYSLSRELLAEGRVSMSARAGQRLLRALNADPSDGLPRAVMSLSYPAAFGPLIRRYSEVEAISPLLLLAFIRQESFFDPRAVSPVGAYGLTQVLPETAQRTAQELGITTDVSIEALRHADLNLRLGARFMSSQLQRFEGDIYVALAAYNAGPNAAERWDAAAGDDADFYLETIEFAETRSYVEIVAENYAIYRYIYGGEPEPNLP